MQQDIHPNPSHLWSFFEHVKDEEAYFLQQGWAGFIRFSGAVDIKLSRRYSKPRHRGRVESN